MHTVEYWKSRPTGGFELIESTPPLSLKTLIETAHRRVEDRPASCELVTATCNDTHQEIIMWRQPTNVVPPKKRVVRKKALTL